MAENINPKGKKPDNKDKKPKFNVNWIFGAAFLGLILINLLFGGKGVTKSQEWGDVERMIENHDIEKIVIINETKAEIFLTQQALE